MQQRTRSRLLLLLKAASSIAILVIIAARTDFSKVGAAIASLRSEFFVAALATLILQTAVNAYRWTLVMSAQRVAIRLSAALPALYVGLLLNQCLPSYVGGDSYRVLWLYNQGNELGAAVRGVIIDRVSAMIALVLMAAASLPLTTGLVSDPAFHAAMLVIVAGGVVATAAFVSLDHLPLPQRLAGRLRQLSQLAVSARATLFRPHPGVAVVVLALCIHVLSGVVLYLLATGMRIPLHLIDCLLLVAPIALLASLPISVAGWGVREGAVVAVLSVIGIPRESALALSLLFGLAALVNALGGLAPLAFGGERYFPSRLSGPTDRVSAEGL